MFLYEFSQFGQSIVKLFLFLEQDNFKNSTYRLDILCKIDYMLKTLTSPKSLPHAFDFNLLIGF